MTDIIVDHLLDAREMQLQAACSTLAGSDHWRLFGGTPGYEEQPSIWVNYNDLTTTSLEIMVSKGNHPQMALIQISELL